MKQFIAVIVLAVVASVCGCSKPKEYKGTYAPVVEYNTESVLPWWETHHAKCPGTMRTVTPSIREMVDKAGFGASSDDQLNWSVRHTYCIPDGEK